MPINGIMNAIIVSISKAIHWPDSPAGTNVHIEMSGNRNHGIVERMKLRISARPFFIVFMVINITAGAEIKE